MDRRNWEKTLTLFQACARGHAVRKEVRHAQEDFEDIVKEIDGGLAHLEWRESVIPIPHFTDTDGPFLRPKSSASKPSDPGLGISASSQSPAGDPLSEGRGGDHRLLLQKIEAERDDSQTEKRTCLSRNCSSSSPVRGTGEEQQVSTVRGMESTGDSTSIWSSLDLDGHSHKGPQQHCLAQEVPRTPEALRLHRNTLSMELLWLQQAIDSRKKYLSLKEKLSISSQHK